MQDLVAAIGKALYLAAAMGWEILWGLVFSFVLSAMIDALTSKAELQKLLPDASPRSIMRASLLGAASSSYSLAAVAIAHSIFRKGGDFTAAMAFQFASTQSGHRGGGAAGSAAGMELRHVAVFGRVVAALAALASVPALATTKGLSQIVTPDLQPVGQLSISFQAQAQQIANPYQLQFELGLTPWFEVAVFQGLDPNEQDFGTELGLVNHGPWLLTTGFINWSTRGQAPQPFLEGGYYTEHDKFMAGPILVHGRVETLLGWAHDFNPIWRFQLDYQSGADNYFTVGFTCNVTDRFQFNPAIYFANRSGHRPLGYIVFTYTLPLWSPLQ